MMDRKVQRELVKSMLSLTDIMRKINWADVQQRQSVLDILYAVDEQCRGSFSAARYTYYGDAIQGLSQTIATAPWETMGAVEAKDACQLCQDILHYLIKELREEKEIKKEIVFLPYKASMWDSLESVWKAAFDDKENCNTYVIPIPYGDRKPDGTAEEWHCEADQFPSYVPVLNWREYSFEKLKRMRPDIIYIHNPYDNCNAVTSVDSAYYSTNLKKCTDMLVYIPYFIVDDRGGVAKHFCQAPGVVAADRVIVQSEAVKEEYIRNYPGGNPPADKFLALGSPKLDKVRTSKREDFELPAAWQSLLTGKKAVFFNLSIVPLLNHADVFLKNLRYVFSVFRNRKDVVLWWRPHPLLQTTIDSMATELATGYAQLLQEYETEGWGIYDDSADLHRAICWTDAYYGDTSSVVQLYEATGKPVMLQDLSAWEKKQFVMGAPDFLLLYQLLTCPLDRFPLPEEWQQKIQGKKSILYYLTKESLLADPHTFVSKLHAVCSAVEVEEDILIWFQPEAGLMDVIEHLGAEVENGYLEFVRQCKASLHCLYDDSADTMRAVLWTDAYYGEMSVPVWTYTYMRKPVMLQDMQQQTASLAFARTGRRGIQAESARIASQYANCYLCREPSLDEYQAITAAAYRESLQAKRQDYPLPTGWQEKIAGRKVIFYQLSPASFVNGAAALEANLQNLCRLFANCGNAILWWYADPALKDMIREESHDVGLLTDYEALESEYRDAESIIFDDSGNLPRAIAWTDVYYGGQTEQMWVFKATGKPVMLENLAAQGEDLTTDAWECVSTISAAGKQPSALDLPEKWQNLIQGKKVVLYYMTWKNVLEHIDKVNAKLQYVFETFKAQQDVVLWWKVDPMIETAMKLSAPEKAEEYRRIAREYLVDGWGIYDDALSMNQIISCWDAYYGDRCWFTEAYRCQSKIRPILWEDINQQKDQDSFCFGNLVMAGDSAWGISLSYPLLCEIDLVSHQVKRMLPLPGEPFVKNAVQYIALGKMNQELVLIPYKNNRVLFYDLKKEEFRCQVLNISPAVLDPVEYCFDPCALWKNRYLLLFPTHKPVIIRCDLQTGECQYYTAWYKVIKDELPYPQSQIFGRIVQPRLDDDSILVACKQMNAVLELNLETEKVTLHRIGREEYHFMGIYRNKNEYWLTTIDKAVIINWDYQTSECKEYKIFPQGFFYESRDGMPFFSLTCYEDGVVVLPYAANMILLLDYESGKIKGIPTSCRYPDMIETKPGRFVASRNAGHGGQGVSFFDLQTNTIEDLDAYLDEDGEKSAVTVAWNHSAEKVWTEWNLSCTLFMRNLTFLIKEYVEKNVENKKVSTGWKIHDALHIER